MCVRMLRIMLPGSCIAGMGRIEKFSGFQIHRSMQTVVIDHSAVSSHLKHCIDHMRLPLGIDHRHHAHGIDGIRVHLRNVRVILDHILDGREMLFFDIGQKSVAIREFLGFQKLTANAAGEILHFGENLLARIKEMLHFFIRRRLQIQTLSADKILEYLIEFILVVKYMRVAVIVHEHHQLLAAKPGQICVALLGIKIPEFKNDIIVVARTVTLHTMQHIKKQIDFIFAGAFMRVIQHLKKFFKARALAYPHIIL